ncbi:hypothetical protein LTR29_012722 [Friedmanniomyces endolithicus]|nr:hypothetical protein LTR29_012722 [Friedmanniomyces endolithicus]
MVSKFILMTSPVVQNTYSRRWEDKFDGTFGLQLDPSLDYIGLTAQHDSEWPFFLPSGTAGLPPMLQPSAATLVGISDPWSPLWYATCVDHVYRTASGDTVEVDHHGRRRSPSWPMPDVYWTQELTDRTAPKLDPDSQPFGYIPVNPLNNPTQSVSVSSLFPDLSSNRSTPLVHLPHTRSQSPRFEGDLYAALWVSGEGADRTGWCGYCSSWHKLKDSAYWYHMQYSVSMS